MLTEKGLTLSQIEKILPLVDKLGVLPIAIKNKWLFLNLLLPLLVEPAPYIIGPLAGLIKVGGYPPIAVGTLLLAWDAYSVSNDDHLIVDFFVGKLDFVGGFTLLIGGLIATIGLIFEGKLYPLLVSLAEADFPELPAIDVQLPMVDLPDVAAAFEAEKPTTKPAKGLSLPLSD